MNTLLCSYLSTHAAEDTLFVLWGFSPEDANLRLQEDLKARYYNAPDLEWVGKNGWRFINAVSDFATHADPIRKTRNYNENLFLRTAEGIPMIDKAYKMVLAAA